MVAPPTRLDRGGQQAPKRNCLLRFLLALVRARAADGRARRPQDSIRAPCPEHSAEDGADSSMLGADKEYRITAPLREKCNLCGAGIEDDQVVSPLPCKLGNALACRKSEARPVTNKVRPKGSATRAPVRSNEGDPSAECACGREGRAGRCPIAFRSGRGTRSN